MKNYSILLAVGILLLGSCVSNKKFHSEQKRVKNLQTDSVGTHSKLADCITKTAGLEKDQAELQKALTSLSSNSQNAIANSKLTIAEQQSMLKSSNLTILEQAKRLNEMQSLIQSQKDIVNKLKKSVADALVNFKPDELSVYIKDGKLYVSLQEKLLFKSGSAVVDPKGKEALKSLATVLNATPDISVVIEGHTDNVPIKGKYEDNWSLSTERATSIVRILTGDYKVNSQSIVATGRSEFYPVADNTSTEGKAKNRRTEIILSPNLSELFKLINQ